MEWRDHAACAGMDTNIFFPPPGTGHDVEAKAVCAACPVRAACRDEGRSVGAHGIWGGEGERARTRAGFKIRNAVAAALKDGSLDPAESARAS